MRNVLIFVDLFSLLAISFFFLYVVSIESGDQMVPRKDGSVSLQQDSSVWMVVITDSEGRKLLGTRIELDAKFPEVGSDGTTVVDYADDGVLYVVASLGEQGTTMSVRPVVVVSRVIDRALLGNLVTVSVGTVRAGELAKFSMKIGAWDDIEL